jgi:hypothetical protein
MLKYQNLARPGDRIRSYDFEGRPDCFIEGVVNRITAEAGYTAFAVIVDRDVWAASDDPNGRSRVGLTVFVPLEMAWGEYPGRVVNLDRP